MAEVNFRTLQNLHESLLQKQQSVTQASQQGFGREVREYIEQAKRAGSYISSTRDRDQIRANLRYWANYIYGLDGVFPNTELAPSTITGRQSFWTNWLNLIIVGLVFVILIGLGSSLLNNNTNTTPTVTSTTESIPTTPAPVTSTIETIVSEIPPPTSIFGTASLVALTSPENGANVLPNVKFEGAAVNLNPEDSIHLLIVRGDLLFPIKEFIPKAQVSITGEWKVVASLYRDAKELEQSENLIVVPAVCSDQQCRDTLENAVDTGFSISPLPAPLSFNSFTVYRDSSRVLYRNAYHAVLGTRLVYSLSENQTPYDLYISGPSGDEEDMRQITFTSNVSELSPSISPDGTKIAYVQFSPTTKNYSIHIMDSNGENDFQITDGTTNILESPQWSPDSSYISYAMSFTPESSNRASWNIHYCKIRNQNDDLIIKELQCKFSSPEDQTLLDQPRSFVQPYHTWLPDMNSIIFESRPQSTGTTGFDIRTLESSGESVHFFDTEEDDTQPSIKRLENGYLLTYTIVRADKKHDIWAALVISNQHFPFDGFKIRLTRTSAGQMVNGIESTSTNFPIPDPNSNSIYYIRNSDIYILKYTIVDNEINRLETNNGDGETYGDLIIKTNPGQDISGFDVGNMEAFFPIN